MKKQNNNSFFDSNTILALVITFALFFLWQTYLQKKYPDRNKKAYQETLANTEVQQKDSIPETPSPSAVPTASTSEERDVTNYEDFSYEDDKMSFKVLSKGMALSDLSVYKFNKVAKTPYHFDSSKEIFPTKIKDQILNFKISKLGDATFVGKANSSNGSTIEKTMKVFSKKYIIEVSIKVTRANGSVEIQHFLESTISDPKKPIPLMPAFERNEFYLVSNEETERKILNTKSSTEQPEVYRGVKLASLADHYFANAFINTGTVSPTVTYTQDLKRVKVLLSYNLSEAIKTDTLNYSLFLGPKRVDLLESVSDELLSIIDFTYLGFIARPIIKAINFLYTYLGNYGLAVVLLTLLIRLLIMPLAVSSFKSMKKMQVIQPKLKEIKEKYKDQPQKVNQLTMQVMKENKVNPLGGCLPMLLQLPIFFAFYRGLSESVDLYQAPFFFWIEDLSKMDPYFVFPILSMAGMLVHQLVTPSNMDKAQKRVMMIMPVVFGALFVTLPSALTIYMAVSTWFGIGQHYVFLRDK